MSYHELMKLTAGFCFVALIAGPAFAADTYRFENLGAPKIAGQTFPNLCFDQGFLSRAGWVTFPARTIVSELFDIEKTVDYTNVRYSDATGFETTESILNAVAVNDLGDVVLGGSWVSGSWRPSAGGVIWRRNGTFEPLVKPSDPNLLIRVTGINKDLDYVGYLWNSSGNEPKGAYVQKGILMPSLAPSGQYAGINNRGVSSFVYYSSSANIGRFRPDLGFTLCPQTITYRRTTSQIEEVPFLSINDNDEFVVAGGGTPASLMISSPTGSTKVTPPSSMKTTSYSRFYINNNRQIAIRISVASSTDPWYVWDGTNFHNLGTAASSTFPPGFAVSSLYGIDDQGRVWGSFLDAQGHSQLGRFVPISTVSKRRSIR